MNFYTNVIQWGNNLLVREIKNGIRINSRVRYSPTLYAPVKKQTPYKNLNGGYVTDLTFSTMKEAKEWVDFMKDQPHLVYGNTQYPYTYISDTHKGQVDWDLEKILIVTIDIEVQCENGFPSPKLAEEELLSITIKNHQTKRIVVWGIGDFETDREDVNYIKCESEVHLLKEFLVFWEKYCPDIVTGWNSEFFDIPYVCNRIKKLFGEDELKRLSPWGGVKEREIFQMGRHHQVYEIQGIAALDYFDLYRKFTYSAQESYRLDYIAKVELGEEKTGNPFETFREWYTKDYQSFIEYNIQDVEIVDKLEDKMKLIELCLTMAYDAKVNYTDVLGSVRYWDIFIYNYLREKNIVIPQKSKSEKVEKFEGAYVKDPQVGMHKWVMSFDLNSLYPHLIMQYNISPETLMPSEIKEGMVDKILAGKIGNTTDYCMTPNGAFFRKTKEDSCRRSWRICIMIEQNIKDLCWMLSKNMRILKTLSSSKTYQDITTSKWRRRFLLILHTVLLGTIGLGILILESLLQLQRLANFLYGGLRKLLTFISTNSWIQKMKIMLSHLILIPFTLLLISLLTKCFRRELKQKKLLPSWTRLQLRSWNLLLIKVLKLLLRL